MTNVGKFVISLDFELLWGVRDKRTVRRYGENIRGVHEVVPRLLDLFDRYRIRATFATVGFLFFEHKEELLSNLPEKRPNYQKKVLSPYNSHLETVGCSPQDDPYHFAPHLIRLIRQYPGQEIGTHTFSHYYCLEEGQTAEDFRADIRQAQKVADAYGIALTSLVFPRNQFNEEYLEICRELGILCYRGNEHAWLYVAESNNRKKILKRALKLADAYVNLSGHHVYADDYLKSKFPIDIPASRFLRPYSEKLRMFEGLRLRRITSGMTYAAKNHRTYHLWWHPHNFGVRQNENFAFLEKILKHYTRLHEKYGFRSYGMTELAHEIIKQK